VATRPPGLDSDRTETDSPDAPTVDREPPARTPPGAAAAGRDALLPVRDGVRDEELDVEIRLGERETLDDSDPPELDEELEPPLELELEPEPPPELEPDDPDEPDEPELEDPELLPRGTACAPARLGAVSVKAMMRLKARRVDLAMVVTPEAERRASSNVLGCNSTATR
jgi:hypothetical protein